MNIRSKRPETRVFLLPDFWLRLLLAVVVALPMSQIAYAQQQDAQDQAYAAQQVDHFKLVSTVEYIAQRSGDSRQYRHQAEPWFTVFKQPGNSEVNHYSVFTNDLDFMDYYDQDQVDSFSQINYSLTDNRYMSGVDEDLLHLQKMNNEAVRSLENKPAIGVGKTWTHRFNLGIFDHYSLPDELKFTVTSIEVPTDDLGDLVAVRAISDNFLVKGAKQGQGYDYVKCRLASVYLFDPYVLERNAEDIYVSATVFVAATKMDDMVQQYRYEFGTYKTDANGTAIALDGLGEEFEDFVKKIQLIPEPIEVETKAGLPFWAQSEIVNAAQISSACAAIACEQNVVNPVSSIYLAAARVYGFQGECSLVPDVPERSVCQALRQDVSALTLMQICGEEGFLPLGWLLIGAAVAIPLAVCDNCDDPKSPCKP